MSALILPGQPGWFGMVSPRQEEMPDFLKLIAQGWRTPKRKWEDLWRLRRGELNHVLGMRKFGRPKYQRGSVSAFVQAAAAQQGVATGTMPDLSDITHEESNVAPTASRIDIWYNSDGEIRFHSSSALNPTYATLTTQSDDANDHTNEWWPDQPDVNEGLNWDIRYTNLVTGGTVTSRSFFDDGGGDRVEDTWYLLDTVSNDAGDTLTTGSIRINRNNGIAKTPDVGSGDQVMDIEIRVTGSGGAVASHQVDQTATGT